MQRQARHTRSLITLALLAALTTSPVLAQTKPQTSTTTPAAAPAASTAAPTEAIDPETTAKINAAQLASAGWLTLLDQRNWGTSWDGASQTFRTAVPIGTWMDGIPKLRMPFGAFVERTPITATYNPDNGFVTALFRSKFANKSDLEETVTSVQDADGKWRVTGYSTR